MQMFRFGAKLSNFHFICYFYYTVWLSDRTLWILLFSHSKLCTFYVLGWFPTHGGSYKGVAYSQGASNGEVIPT